MSRNIKNNFKHYKNDFIEQVTPIKNRLAHFLKLDTGVIEKEKDDLSDYEFALDLNKIIAHRSKSREADVFRFLRTQVLQGMEKHGMKTIAITSPRYGDGKTTTSANLAVSIAQDLKQTVLLVDLDLRSPSLDSIMSIKPQYGLTDYLSGQKTVPECMQRTVFERFTIFPAGTPIDKSSETLGSPQMKKLAAELKDRYSDRIVIYDMPPLLEQDDPLVFLPHVDGVLLVVREGVTTSEEIKRCLDILSGAKVLGIVLNAVK